MLTCSSDLSLLRAVVAGFFFVRLGENFFVVAKMLLGFFVGSLGFSDLAGLIVSPFRWIWSVGTWI